MGGGLSRQQAKSLIRIEIPPHEALRCSGEPHRRVGLLENGYESFVRMVRCYRKTGDIEYVRHGIRQRKRSIKL